MSQKMLLIVEDNPLQLKWLVAIFKCSFTVLNATTGIEAQQLFAKHQYDIDALILDIRLPDMTAFELLNSLEKMSFAGIPPTIIETEYDDKAWMQEMFGDHRTLNYLVKPFTKNEIEEAVGHALKADPCLYKGTQLEERLSVMSVLGTLRHALYRRVLQMPEDQQKRLLSEIEALFPVYRLGEDTFPSGDKEDDFNLGSSFKPIFNLIEQLYGLSVPPMGQFRLGVPLEMSKEINGILARKYLEKGPNSSPKFELLEIDHPTQKNALDFWVQPLNKQNLEFWKGLSTLWLPYQETGSVCGIAIINSQEQDLLKQAILLGIPYVVLKIPQFKIKFYDFLVKLATRQYELKVLKSLCSKI